MFRFSKQPLFRPIAPQDASRKDQTAKSMAGAFSMAFRGCMHLPRGTRDICILIAPQAAGRMSNGDLGCWRRDRGVDLQMRLVFQILVGQSLKRT